MSERMFDQDAYNTPYWQAFKRDDGTVRVHTATQYGTTTDTVFPHTDAFFVWKRRHYGMIGEVETGGHCGGTRGGGLRNLR